MGERPTLETERLILRPFRATDAAEVRRLAGDPEIASTTLNIPHPYEPGMAETWIATHQPGHEEGRLVNFAVTRREGGSLLGAVGLVVSPAHARAELGYWIGREHWNQGYATEAARAVVRHGFEALGLNRVVAHHFSRNPASGRVLEKAGMLREGRLPQHVRKSDAGPFEDLEIYGVLAGHTATGKNPPVSPRRRGHARDP